MLYQLPNPKVGSIQGPTIYGTDPIPPVSNPVLNYYVPFLNRYLDQTVKSFSGSTIQQTYTGFHNTTSWSSAKIISVGNSIPINSATIQNTYIYLLSNPEFRYYLRNTFSNVFIDQNFVPRTDPIPPVSSPLFNYYLRNQNNYQIIGPEKRFDGATVLRTDPIPPVSNPVFNYYVPFLNRYLDEAVKSFLGSTVQQTYVGFHNTTSWSALQVIDAVSSAPISGSTSQQTYLFPLSEPIYKYYLRNTFSDVFLYPHFVSSAAPQTYIFPISQPEYTQINLRMQILRYILTVIPRFEGATVQQTFPIPTTYQSLNRYPYRPYSQTITPIDIRIANKSFSYGYFIQ